jgi:splicing factor 3B subunit 4
LFVGNLDIELDEKQLYDIFGAFGNLLQVKIVRDDNGVSKGFAFLHFDDFSSSDAALQTMDHQYIQNQPVTITYAFKKGGQPGERHGTPAERLLAAQLKTHPQ